MGYVKKPEKIPEGVNPDFYKGEIKTVHRLDRQTSGIVFFAKTEHTSNNFRTLMLQNKI